MLASACGSVGPCSIGSCLGRQTLVARLPHLAVSLAQVGRVRCRDDTARVRHHVPRDRGGRGQSGRVLGPRVVHRGRDVRVHWRRAARALGRGRVRALRAGLVRPVLHAAVPARRRRAALLRPRLLQDRVRVLHLRHQRCDRVLDGGAVRRVPGRALRARLPRRVPWQWLRLLRKGMAPALPPPQYQPRCHNWGVGRGRVMSCACHSAVMEALPDTSPRAFVRALRLACSARNCPSNRFPNCEGPPWRPLCEYPPPPAPSAARARAFPFSGVGACGSDCWADDVFHLEAIVQFVIALGVLLQPSPRSSANAWGVRLGVRCFGIAGPSGGGGGMSEIFEVCLSPVGVGCGRNVKDGISTGGCRYFWGWQ